MTIQLATIGDLIDQGYGLTGWCPTCQTGRPVDLEALATRYGRDVTFIKPQSPIQLRCRDCGASADYQLKTPDPYAG